MTTRISTDNIQPSTLENLGGSPTIANVQITDSNYTVLDDTAIALEGGFVRIIGTKFVSGCSVIVNRSSATSVTFVSATEVRAVLPALPAGTYVMYVVNPDSSVAIRVNAITYSATPTWVTGSTLPPNVIDTPISIQLSATGASTFAVQAGSTIPTGLTLAANGLLSGTITGLTNETTYNFTVVATDTELQDSPRAFSITISAGDIFRPQVTMHLSPVLPITPFVADASTNNANINVFGDTRPNNFNPYTLGWYSAFFDGTGDSISAASRTASAFGTGDFTVECWFYKTTDTNSFFEVLWDCRNTDNATSGFAFGPTNAGEFVTYGLGGARVVEFSGIARNTWYHVAITRSGTTCRIFLDGVLRVTKTVSNNYTEFRYTSGSDQSLAGYFFGGFISNLRTVQGTALYTAAFTPPTTPLTAVAGTTVLTCQGSRIIDASSVGAAITRTGDTRVSGFVPFAPNTNFSTYGSAYLDGTDDYLFAPATTGFDFASGDWTIECWVYFNSVANTPHIWQFGASNTSRANLYLTAGKLAVYSGSIVLNGTATIVAGRWYHLAVTFVASNTTTRLFVDGVLDGTTTTHNGYPKNANDIAFMVGHQAYLGGAGDFLSAYVSDIRIVKGTAVYTTAFTPPTQPLTAISGTTLLTCQTDQPINSRSIIDNSTNNLLLTRFGNASQGTFSPYGENWSNYFDGTGDNLTFPNVAALGSGNFTIEFWFFAPDVTTAQNIYEGRPATLNGAYPTIYVSTGTVRYRVDSADRITSATIQPNVWYHVAVVRNSGTTTMYINGTAAGTWTDATTYLTGANRPLIGSFNGSSSNYIGYLSNLRVVIGTAVYTSSFTPSATPLQSIPNTAILTCQSSRIADNSPNRYTVTRQGDVAVQEFGPFPGAALPSPTYSAFFDGTGDFITVPDNANLEIGSNVDFTVEAWFYATGAGNATNTIVAKSASAVFGPYTIYYTNTSTVTFFSSSNGTSWDVANAVSLGNAALNTWHHVAVSREGSSIRLFLNGVLSATVTSSAALHNNTTAVGIGGRSSGTELFTGSISNVRIVVGTAVYTSAFTPSTTPLTAITNTSLLTCQNNTFIDNSPNNFTITSNGDARPVAFSPFATTYLPKQTYAPATFGGSVYFDGTGDYLQTPTYLQELAPGTGDYTIEFWVYPQSTARQDWFNLGAASGFNRILIYYKASATQIAVDIGSGSAASTVLSLAGAPQLNRWYHIAVCRASGSTRLFVDGIQSGSAFSDTNNITSPLQLTLGRDPGGTTHITGYMSDVRYVRRALYTSNFAPQNAPLTPIPSTLALLNMNSAGIYDSASLVNLETVADARIATSTRRFGNTSIFFDGTGDYLVTPSNPVFNMSGDFTIELWANFSALSSNRLLVDRWTTGNAAGWQLYWRSTGTSIAFLVGASVIVQDPSTTRITANTWYHVAVTRASGTVRLFVDGVLTANATNTVSLTSTLPLALGMQVSTTTNPLSGSISDFRITNGVARYTANFTPPAAAFLTR